MRFGSASISVALLSAAYIPPARAELEAEYPAAVATFEKACLAGGLDSDRPTVVGALADWHEDSAVSVDVSKLQISRAIEVNYDFTKVASARQWSGLVDGKPARIVIADFDPKSRYPHLCALVVPGVTNAMPYGSALGAAFKRFGIGGKSVDLVHYYEFAGKVGTGRHPVRGEVFSRSMAGQTRDTMHMYVAY